MAAFANYQKVLMLFPTRMGEIIFNTPALALLKKHYPKIDVDILSPTPLVKQVLANNPLVNAFIINDDLASYSQLGQNYDAVINVHPNTRYDEYVQQLGNVNSFVIASEQPAIHTTEYRLQFMASILGVAITDADRVYQLYPNQMDENSIDNLLSSEFSRLSDNDILIGCHMGCHSYSKKVLKWWQKKPKSLRAWPVKQYIHFAKLLKREYPKARFVLTGSQNERYLAEQFIKKVPDSITLMGRTSVMEMASLMKRLDAFVTGDTGALHVACAMKVNLLAIFALPISMTQTGPYPKRDNQIILYKPNITAITGAEAVAALKQFLS